MTSLLRLAQLSLAAVLLCTSCPLLAQTDSLSTDTLVPPTWEQQKVAALQAIVQQADSQPFVAGISVRDLTTDKPLFSHNAQKSLRPASTQKLLTAIAALDILGAAHELETRVCYDGTIDSIRLKRPLAATLPADTVAESAPLVPDSAEVVCRILRGNVYVVGGYDPLFSTFDLRQAASAIRQLGIDSIAGQLVGIVSMTDTLRLGSGWCWDDVPSTNCPYLSPLRVNRGLTDDGRTERVSAQPEREVLRLLAQQLRALQVGCDPQSCRIVADRPVPSGALLLYRRAHTLTQVMKEMMKESDNLHAESVFFQLAAHARPLGATSKDAAALVRATAEKAGGAGASLRVADGSGLSLYNYVTAETLTQLLRYAQLRPGLYSALLGSLPVAGVDGTLKRRMTSGPAFGKVFAKTGTVAGVISLAGYAQAANGHLLAFTILCNGAMQAAEARAFQDRLCEALCR
jgi:D-alanyl-D-alanine carboxypeptidase/D-alanyl-D-alanine-endopeptidase (penicillin-binding protein 4)